MTARTLTGAPFLHWAGAVILSLMWIWFIIIGLALGSLVAGFVALAGRLDRRWPGAGAALLVSVAIGWLTVGVGIVIFGEPYQSSVEDVCTGPRQFC